MDVRMNRIWSKICAPPQPFKDINVLNAYDACGASKLYGRTTMRDCMTTYFGFKARIPLDMMYQLLCLLNQEKQTDVNAKVDACMEKIAQITPKQEYTDALTKFKALKTSEERKKFMDNLMLERIRCQEKALSL